MVELRDGERIDDLQAAGYRIIQHPARFCFGTDAVLLAHFAHAPKDAKWLDLGTGTGILPLLIAAHRPFASFQALEIQPEAADMAARSMELNGLSGRIQVTCANILDAPGLFGTGAFDAAVCNPPYGKRGAALQNPEDAKSIARHEVLITLPEIAQTASKLLRNGGRLFMIHQAERLVELLCLLCESRLEPKRVRLLYPRPGKNAHLVLVEAVKLGGAGCVFLPPLCIHDEQGRLNEETKRIYAGEQDILYP